VSRSASITSICASCSACFSMSPAIRRNDLPRAVCVSNDQGPVSKAWEAASTAIRSHLRSRPHETKPTRMASIW
jgi:hypothetical protein